MPKVVPLRLRRLLAGPVAGRTRLKLGIPIRKHQSVQYPCEYFEAKHKSYYKKKKKKPVNLKGFVAPTLDSKETNGENDYDGMDNRHKTATRRPSHMDTDDGFFRFEPSKRARIRKATTSRRINKSLIQMVTLKTLRRRDEKGNHSTTKRRRTAGARRRKLSRRRKRNTEGLSRKRVSKRRLRKRAFKGRSKKRQVTSRKGRRQQQTSLLRRKRRNQKSLVRKKKRAAQLKKRWQRRSNRGRRDGSAEGRQHRRRNYIPDKSPSHEKDNMLTAQDEVVTSTWDEGHDDDKEDPLNVKEICRSLVKGLHGIPADCREVTTDEKSGRPENKKPSDRTQKRRKTKSRRQRNQKKSNKTRARKKTKFSAQRKDQRRRRGPTNRKRKSKWLTRGTYRPYLNRNNKRRVDKLARKVERKSSWKQKHPHRLSNKPAHKNPTKHYSHVRNRKVTRQNGAKRALESKLRHRKLGQRAHTKKMKNCNNSWTTDVNKNNNQDNETYWCRVTGRLTRVSFLILRRLRQLWRLQY